MLRTRPKVTKSSPMRLARAWVVARSFTRSTSSSCFALSSSSALTGSVRSFLTSSAIGTHTRVGEEEPGFLHLPVAALGGQRLLLLIHKPAIQAARAPAGENLAG